MPTKPENKNLVNIIKNFMDEFTNRSVTEDRMASVLGFISRSGGRMIKTTAAGLRNRTALELSIATGMDGGKRSKAASSPAARPLP